MDEALATKMEGLCASIPCLANMPETATWNPRLLAARWGTASSGERGAIAFVLSVWSSDNSDWTHVPPFSLDHFAHLDEGNQAAIARWFAKPFWP